MKNELLKKVISPISRTAVILLVSLFVCLYLAGKIKEASELIVENRQMLLLHQNSREQFAILKEDLPKVSPHIEKVDGAFPISENMLPFINAMEGVAASTGMSQSFKFDNAIPQSVSGLDLSTIPFSATLNGNRLQFYNYLLGLEKMPYFVKIESLSMMTSQAFDGPSQLGVRGLLYIRQ